MTLKEKKNHYNVKLLRSNIEDYAIQVMSDVMICLRVSRHTHL